MRCSVSAQSLLIEENDSLKKQLIKLHKEITSVKFQYQSLEEDFMHAVNNKIEISLKGKKIAYIGGNGGSMAEYQKIAKLYQIDLITPKNDSFEAICKAVELADEVVCPLDCKNQELCHSARSSSTKFNKPFRSVENNSPQILQQELKNIAIQVQ